MVAACSAVSIFGCTPSRTTAGPIPSADRLPTRTAASRWGSTGQPFFDVGRYFDDDVDLTQPLSSFVRWTAGASSRYQLKVQSIQIYGRVTDDVPGFGVVPTSRTLSTIASMNASLDISVYTAPAEPDRPRPS